MSTELPAELTLSQKRALAGSKGGSAGVGKAKRRSKRHYREAGRKGGLISRKPGAMPVVKPEGQTS